MKHIDKLFQEKLYNHEAPVPEGMWEKIAPIAEEETGRAILWFWFAGLIALALGGYGLYQMMQKESQQVDPSTLVYETNYESQSNTILASNEMSFDNKGEITNEDASSFALNTKVENKIESSVSINEEVNNPRTSKTIRKNNNRKAKIEKRSNQIVSNTVENISGAEGIPANLVITKSYINGEGSIIRQSNLNNDSQDDEVYDVIINSEAKNLNAGALLRIVEPLEQISLPALGRQLKKKNQVTIF